MKRKIYSDPEEVRKELQAIADELNLPITLKHQKNEYIFCYIYIKRLY